MTENNAQTNPASQENEAPVFEITKIYLKDVSFESPRAPRIFTIRDFSPQIDVQLRVGHQTLDEAGGVHEVDLVTTVTAKSEEETVFLVEVNQAGIFVLRGFPGDRLEPMLEVACPNILFPYLREAVSDLVSHGGFPQLLLSPVNFEAMYLQKKRPPAEQDDSQAATH